MRVAGFALIIGGVAGLIFSIVALFVLVRIEPYVESAAMEQVVGIVQIALITQGWKLIERSRSKSIDRLVTSV